MLSIPIGRTLIVENTKIRKYTARAIYLLFCTFFQEKCMYVYIWQ